MEPQLFRLLSYESQTGQATEDNQMRLLRNNLLEWLKNNPRKAEAKVYIGKGAGMFKIFIFIPVKDPKDPIRWDAEFAETLKIEMNVESRDDLVLEAIKP